MPSVGAVNEHCQFGLQFSVRRECRRRESAHNEVAGGSIDEISRRRTKASLDEVSHRRSTHVLCDDESGSTRRRVSLV
jgi:hypothetical protein